MEYFNILDKHFEKKNKNINKIADEDQKDKYELAPRNTAEITIGVQELPIYIKNKLKQSRFLLLHRCIFLLLYSLFFIMNLIESR